MGDAARDRLSDRGSIPLRSIEKAQCLLGFFYIGNYVLRDKKFDKLFFLTYNILNKTASKGGWAPRPGKYV